MKKKRGVEQKLILEVIFTSEPLRSHTREQYLRKNNK
jgi:hypothetical protein